MSLYKRGSAVRTPMKNGTSRIARTAGGATGPASSANQRAKDNAQARVARKTGTATKKMAKTTGGTMTPVRRTTKTVQRTMPIDPKRYSR